MVLMMMVVVLQFEYIVYDIFFLVDDKVVDHQCAVKRICCMNVRNPNIK